MTRTPRGTSRQVGSAFYIVSSYVCFVAPRPLHGQRTHNYHLLVQITHSCVPSARPSFPQGTSELHLFANRAIKKGEEITVAFVDTTPRPDETPSAARRRRRIDLHRGWRFACYCEKCLEEGAKGENGTDNDIEGKGELKDESKIVDISKKFEALYPGNGVAQVVD
jgi:mitochondrial import receptor subunit TOM20